MNKSKSGTKYTGNARMIEIGSPGIPFRLMVNVDHIDSIRFEQQMIFEDENDKQGRPQWQVILIINGQGNTIGFPNMEAAMGCYNSIISMTQAVGVPYVFMGALRPPPPPPEIVGVDGEVIEEAVDAALLHPDLAGGEGDGMADNDDGVEDEFKLSDEDLELLENPQIDVDAIDETFAELEPEVPPKAN